MIAIAVATAPTLWMRLGTLSICLLVGYLLQRYHGYRDANTKSVVTATKSSRKRVIVIDGEIGAGKSTLVRTLSELLTRKGYNVCTVMEPVDEWQRNGILHHFYGNPERHAYEFQTFTFATRCLATLEAIQKKPDADVFLVERTILTDKFVFMALQRPNLPDYQVKMYDRFFQAYQIVMPLDLTTAEYVYLKPSLEVCMERVTARGRSEEVAVNSTTASTASTTSKKPQTPAKGGVSVDYQRMLREAHEALLEGRSSDRFPDAAKWPRPFSLSNVTVIDGPLADGNFKGQYTETANAIAAKLGFR